MTELLPFQTKKMKKTLRILRKEDKIFDYNRIIKCERINETVYCYDKD